MRVVHAACFVAACLLGMQVNACSTDSLLDRCETMPLGFMYHIVNKNSGKAVNIRGVSNADGETVHQWSIHTWEHGNLNDNWRFHTTGVPGQYKVIVEHSSLAMHVASNANVFQSAVRWNDTVDNWCFVRANGSTNDEFWIVNANTEEVLDVQGQSLDDGGNIITDDLDTSSVSQVWQITPAVPLPTGVCAALEQDTYFEIVNVNSGKAANIQGLSSANGGNVHQWTIHTPSEVGFENDNWKFEPTLIPGFHHAIVELSGKALNVQGVSYASGANVHQWSVSSDTNDDWCFIPTGRSDGSFWIVNHKSQMLLDVEGGASFNGGNIIQQVFDPNSASQMWRLQFAYPQSIDGSWEGPYPTSGIVGTGAVNLPDNRVLLFASKEKDNFSGSINGRTFFTIFDPASGNSMDGLVDETGHDM